MVMIRKVPLPQDPHASLFFFFLFLLDKQELYAAGSGDAIEGLTSIKGAHLGITKGCGTLLLSRKWY